jgi:hypothetical protein
MVTQKDIRPPVNLKIASMKDLARMLVSWSGRDRPASMLYFENRGKHIYGTLIAHHGYYEMYGLPLWVYTEGDGPPRGNFLTYKTREKETIDFAESVDSDPMTIHLPIIRLSEKPIIIDL